MSTLLILLASVKERKKENVRERVFLYRSGRVKTVWFQRTMRGKKEKDNDGEQREILEKKRKENKRKSRRR